MPPDQKEILSAHRRLRLCAWCKKSKSSDVTLMRCSSCQVDFFCSKECQRAAWPTHREKCKADQARLALYPEEAEIMKTLRNWGRAHRLPLFELAVYDLGAEEDPTIGAREMYAVTVREREGETKLARKFEVLDLCPFPAVDMGEELAEEFHFKYKTASERLVAAGVPPHATFIVGTKIEGYNGINIAPMSFEIGSKMGGGFDREQAIADINAGRTV